MVGGDGKGKVGCWPGFTWLGLSYTEEEKAEAREFEEDQVAGRLKEDVVSVEGGWWEGRDGAGPAPGISPLSSPCSLSREAGCRSRWQRR